MQVIIIRTHQGLQHGMQLSQRHRRLDLKASPDLLSDSRQRDLGWLIGVVAVGDRPTKFFPKPGSSSTDSFTGEKPTASVSGWLSSIAA